MLYIIRGLPGSGKSTYAKQLAFYHHYEADQFFITNGTYNFDAKNLQAAHDWCFKSVCLALAKQENVSVANTFTTVKEMRRYIEAGRAYSSKITVLTCLGDYGSIHGVPTSTVERMKARFASQKDITDHFPDVLFQTIGDTQC